MAKIPAASLIEELQRRNVFRVAIAYAVTAWLLAQVAELAATNFQAPDWVMKMIITVLLLGLPVALIMAWAYEMTPQGLRRDPADVDGRAEDSAKSSALNRVIAAALMLSLAYIAYDKWVADLTSDSATPESSVDRSLDPTTAHDLPREGVQVPVHSIAVLPFLNMSNDVDNEYFADGLSEELLNMLVRNPQLRVAARTSSFSFKGKDAKISDIARELQVSYVLEGSVRQSGNQLRITAQLIKAEDGFHLWSETYDRTMDEIFVIQDEIAGKVAEALEVTLLGTSRTEKEVDPDSYAAYLRGLHFLRQRGPDNVVKATGFFEKAVELDPENGTAWATLAFAYAERVNFGTLSRDEGVPLVKDALEKSNRFDPASAVGRASEGYVRKNLFWDWQGAQTAIEHAHELDKRNQIISGWRASMLISIGRLDDAIRTYEDAFATDPLSLSLHSALGLAYTKAHRYDEAIEIFNRQLELSPDYHWGHSNLGKAWLFKGNAARALEEVHKNPDNIFKAATLPAVYHSLGRDADSDAAMRSLVEEYGNEVGAYFIAGAFSWRGENDAAFEWLEKAMQARAVGIAYILGENLFYPVRDDPRWPAFLKKVNLLEYWEAMPAEYGGPI